MFVFLRKIATILLLLVWFSCGQVRAQDTSGFYKKYRLSLRAIQKGELIPKKIMIDLYDYYNSRNLDSLRYYGLALAKNGIKNNDFLTINIGKTFLLSYLVDHRYLELVKKIGTHTHDYFLNQKDHELMAITENLLGNSLVYAGKYDESRKWFQRSLETAEESGNYEDNSIGLQNIAESYSREGNQKEALIYIQKFISNLKGKDEYSMAVGNGFLTLGNIFREMGDESQRDAYYQKAYEIAKKSNSNVLLGNALTNMGISTFETNPNQSRSYFFQALAVRKKTHKPNYISEGLLNIGYWYDGVTLNKNYTDSAIFYFKKMIAYCTKTKYYDGMNDAYDALEEIYNRNKQYKDLSELLSQSKENLKLMLEDKQSKVEKDLDDIYEVLRMESALTQKNKSKVMAENADRDHLFRNYFVMLFAILMLSIIFVTSYVQRPKTK